MAHKLTLSVSQLNEYVKRMIQLDPVLHNITIKGEISNLKLHQTGTLFFTLKDEEAAISCVMYPQAVSQLQAEPFEGMRAMVSGGVGLYTRGGQYQFYAESLQAQGVGVLYERLMALKSRLSSEGLFDRERKQPLPVYVDTIGVVSSPTGAVIHDILSVSLRRDPDSRILLCPVRVQGMGAAEEVAQAISLLDRMPNVSVIIVARGGGSIEDLWTFNEETVVRAVAGCTKPVVSAVGHETDVTLCDLAADFRAPTPSAAAECVVVPKAERLEALDEAKKRLGELTANRVRHAGDQLRMMRERLSSVHPRRMLEAEKERLNALGDELRSAAKKRLERDGERVSHARKELNLLSPYKVLSRGYAIIKRGEHIVVSSGAVAPDDEVSVQMHDGTFRARVLE